MPCSMAFFAAASAANCAAKGVLFREPLNPLLPELDHVMTFPDVSVIVTIVLLNDAWMCATPLATFFLSLPFLAIIPPHKPRPLPHARLRRHSRQYCTLLLLCQAFFLAPARHRGLLRTFSRP